ncbi:uncharacterized protein LOC121825194 [Peromyscus maniculatus bairdii]|uniref:uncharacterized protein LOC121825194 n=1 Tax=Peromyscus maniculatus bairdii TaxID=230844 RepID=UPI003FD0403D
MGNSTAKAQLATELRELLQKQGTGGGLNIPDWEQVKRDLQKEAETNESLKGEKEEEKAMKPRKKLAVQDDESDLKSIYELLDEEEWLEKEIEELQRQLQKTKRRKFPLYLIGYDPVGKVQRAASVGDLASIERLINCCGYHVNGQDTRRRTSLHYTCAHNHPDVVTLLLSKKASIDVQDDEGYPPLIKATQRDNEVCVTLLLIQGATPHLRDLSADTALHHAVSRDNTTIASIQCHP